MLSASETTKKDDFEHVFEEIEKLKHLSSASDAMAYLKSQYGVDSNTYQFYIFNDIPVRIFNSEKCLSLEISLGNKDFLYCYCKE